MIFKIEHSEITINGKSIVKALIVTYLVTAMYKAIRRVKNTHYIIIDSGMTQVKKEQKTSEKKQKVESK